MVWCSWCGVVFMVLIVWCGVVWCGVVWCGVVDVVWCAMVWCCGVGASLVAFEVFAVLGAVAHGAVMHLTYRPGQHTVGRG